MNDYFLIGSNIARLAEELVELLTLVFVDLSYLLRTFLFELLEQLWEKFLLRCEHHVAQVDTVDVLNGPWELSVWMIVFSVSLCDNLLAEEIAVLHELHLASIEQIGNLAFPIGALEVALAQNER